MAFCRGGYHFRQSVNKYGAPVRVISGGKVSRFKAIVQPYTTNFRRKFGGDETIGKLGGSREYDLVMHYAPGAAILIGDAVVYLGKRYTVVSTGERAFAGQIIYHFAVLRKAEKTDMTDHYNDPIEEADENG